MRKTSKQAKQATVTTVQGYHAGASWGSEDYAFAGFKSNKYFTSDRYVPMDATYNRVDGKPLKGYGIEIETECDSILNPTVLAEVLNKVVFPHFPDDLFKLQRDGSLGGRSSAECITQIMTKEFIRNNYANFKLMFDTYFPAFQISASATGNCGMHVNISRGAFGRSDEAQETAVRKLYYIVNHHYALCCALFFRNAHRTSYCERMQCDLDYVKAMPMQQECSHGISFNLGHWNAGRIELRLVGGQKNYACFRNTMESVFFLVDRVKDLSWADCDDLTKIFSGCNRYVYDRLKSYCRERGTITDAQLAAILPTVDRSVELL